MNVPIQTLCLTHDQIAELLIVDDPTIASLASRQRHLAQCAVCAAEFHMLQAAVGGLRDSAQRSAEAAHAECAGQMRGYRAALLPRPSAPAHRAIWAVAVAAVALVVALPLTHRRVPAPQQIGAAGAASSAAVSGTPAGSAVTDEALLDGINQDLSASVPASLEPLAATSTGSSGTTGDSQALP